MIRRSSPRGFPLLAACALLAGRDARAQLSIADEGVDFRVPSTSDFLGTGGAWNCDFRTHGGSADHLFQMGWAVRFAGIAGQSRLGIPDVADATSDTMTLAYADVGAKGVASAALTIVVDGRDAGDRGTLSARLVLSSLESVDRPLSVAFYADPDVQPDPLDDLATAGGDFGDSLLLENPGGRVLEVRGVERDAWEARDSTTLRAEALSTIVPYSADGSGIPSGPADVRIAMQWNRTLPAGGSVTIEVGLGLDLRATPVELSEYRID